MRTITEGYVKEIKTYVECPELGFTHYGKWGALNREQRLLINDLCDSWLYHVELLDNYVKSWYELKKWIEEDTEVAETNFEMGRCFNMFDLLNKMQKLEGNNE